MSIEANGGQQFADSDDIPALVPVFPHGRANQLLAAY
jgi:hypothetical protein